MNARDAIEPTEDRDKPVREAARIPDHPVQSVRQSAEPETRGNEGAHQRMGQAFPLVAPTTCLTR